ncbi:MAG: bifunctional metallophosphatase/5'-nucleotidase [Burkholderiales bacterium]|nr:bifunctional metallophosphatase/5'-nucleotidase [Burkholderiales bacterium]
MNTRFRRPIPAAVHLMLLGALAGCATPHQPAVQNAAPATTIPVRLLALNDFHGQLPPGRKLGNRLAGGAPVYTAYLRQAEATAPGATFIVDAGDMVGASPLVSSVLHDEPTLMLLNQWANNHCTGGAWDDVDCNMVGTLGNHEFDKGMDELLRLAHGGNAADGPFLQDPWRGAQFPIISANVVWADSGKPVLQPYVIRHAHVRPDGAAQPVDLPIAFIGITTHDTPSLTPPSSTRNVRFLDEADAVNHYLPEIHAQGVHTVVVLIHEGGKQDFYLGETDSSHTAVVGKIVNIVKRLAPGVDIVCSGHTHEFTNSVLPNAAGQPVLVTQGVPYSMGFAQIDLQIDPATDTVVKKTARIVPTYADEGPGLHPDANAAALLAQAERRVGTIANRVVTHIEHDIVRGVNAEGESRLGNLVADALRESAQADFAMLNRHSLRDDLRADIAHEPALPVGSLTYKDLYAVMPFGNTVMRVSMTGQQIYDVLNQQYPKLRPPEDSYGKLFVSGLSYDWDSTRPDQQVVRIYQHGKAIDPQARYTVALNNFVLDGGDGFTAFAAATERVEVMNDLHALELYLVAHTDPATGRYTPPKLGDRVHRVR